MKNLSRIDYRLIHILYWVGVLFSDNYLAKSYDITYARVFLAFYILFGILFWIVYFLNKKIYFLPILLLSLIILYFQDIKI